MKDFKLGSFRIFCTVAVVLSISIILWRASTNSQQPAKSLSVGNRSTSKTLAGDTSADRAKLNLALVSAVKKQDTAQVKSLLSRGADPNARDNSAYKHWQKQMEELVTEQDYPTGKLKTHKRSEGARPYLGPTVLMIAAHQSDNATVQVLINAGADLSSCP